MSDMSNHRSDQLGRRLALLAPAVDMAESRALFEDGRGAPTRSGDRGDGGPRWWLTAAAAALVVSGIVGVWALSRDDTTPVSPTDDPADEPAAEPATDGQITDGIVEPGAGFEVLHVTQTDEPFGQAWLATDAESYDAIPNGGAAAPDFAKSVAVVMTRPDNACPNTLARYEVATGESAVPTWTPVFEEQATVCEDPLLSWVYVVAIDRDALGERADIVAPADDLYGVAEQVLAYEASGSVPSEPVDGAIDVVVEPTGLTVPLPPVGRPAIHNTSAGLIWVVAHEDGAVSVLPATIDLTAYWDGRRNIQDVRNLASLIRVSESGDGFMSRGWFWDDHGRALTSSRSHDLTGYEGRVTGGEVAIFTSTASRIPGDAADVDVELDEYPMPDLGQPIDVMTFLTMSSSGPVWRYFDESLVVEQGVGRICDVPVDLSDEELATCVDAEFALDTAVRHEPTFSTWYHAPILAFQDPIDGFTKVIPLAGGRGRDGEFTAEGIELGIADLVPGAEWTVEGVEDGTILEIRFPGQLRLDGGQICTAEYSATVDETDDAVTIRLWADLLANDAGQQVSCAGGDTERTVVVPLDAPVGDRTIQSADGTILTVATTAGVRSSPSDAPVEYLAIGDSVMLGAAAELESRGYAVDAVSSRELADVAPLVEAVVADGLLADTPIVIHLGYNGPFDEDDLASLLDSLDGFDDVVLLTGHADRTWTAPNNELIKAAGARQDVVILDWATLSDDCGPRCFMADGVHLSEVGVEFYTDRISEVVGR